MSGSIDHKLPQKHVKMSYRDLYLTSAPKVTSVKEGKTPIVDVLGIPFDATSTYRTGSKFGPDAIREAFLNSEIYSSRLNIDLEDFAIEDIGNLNPTGEASQMAEILGKVVSEVFREGQTPAVLGGEHTLSYATFKAVPKDTAVIIFDAHLDLRDEYAGIRFSHTTWLRRFIEERGVESVIHVGARAASKDEVTYLNMMKIPTIPSRTILTTQRSELLFSNLLNDFSRVYVSIDMDVLDPAYAPGVGNPEAAGISTAQLLEFIYTLQDKEILGFDIVELCPAYDTGAAATAAAKCLIELTCLVSIREM
jgi:agmatinase